MTEAVNPNVNELLSFALSNEFSDCSIAAAELNNQVKVELSDHYLRPIPLYEVGPDNNIAKQYITKDLNVVTEVDGNFYGLALIKPHVERPIKKSKFRRVMEETVEIGDDAPILAAISGDMFIPLASFARGDNSKCSYVQIGREMKDYNIFATVADDGGSRKGTIEAMRKLIADKGKTGADERGIMKALVNGELKTNETHLQKAVEAKLVREVYRRNGFEKPVNFQMLDEKTGKVELNNFNYRIVSMKEKLSDGRVTRFILGKVDEKVSLYALARGNIALPLVDFDKDTGTLNFKGDKVLTENQRKYMVEKLETIINPRTPLTQHSLKGGEIHGQYGDIARFGFAYLAELGLFDYGNWSLSRSTKLTDENKYTVRSILRGYLVDEDMGKPFPYKEERYLSKSHSNNLGDGFPGIMKLAKGKIKFGKDFYDTFNLEERFNKALGQTTNEEEALFSLVYKLSGRTEPKVTKVDNCTIGNTTGAATIVVDVSKEGNSYSVVIKGKPTAMTDEEPRPILKLDFDSTKPIYDRTKQKNEEAAKKADDITSILNLVV